jgi:hypothetical protein
MDRKVELLGKLPPDLLLINVKIRPNMLEHIMIFQQIPSPYLTSASGLRA